MDHAVRNMSRQPAELGANQSAQPSGAQSEIARPGRDISLWARVAWFVWLLMGLRLTVRGFDPDELEHLHAAFCLQSGQVPYRDFFEHHAPALYWLAQPVLFFTGPRMTALWILRLGMWLLSTLAVLATTRIARRVLEGPAAALVPGLLLGSSIFFAKGVEFRPDVPAMLLLIIALESALQSTTERLSGRSTQSPRGHLWIMAVCGGGGDTVHPKGDCASSRTGRSRLAGRIAVRSFSALAPRSVLAVGGSGGGLVGGVAGVLVDGGGS